MENKIGEEALEGVQNSYYTVEVGGGCLSSRAVEGRKEEEVKPHNYNTTRLLVPVLFTFVERRKHDGNYGGRVVAYQANNVLIIPEVQGSFSHLNIAKNRRVQYQNPVRLKSDKTGLCITQWRGK